MFGIEFGEASAGFVIALTLGAGGGAVLALMLRLALGEAWRR
jgi:hypothetical protein